MNGPVSRSIGILVFLGILTAVSCSRRSSLPEEGVPVSQLVRRSNTSVWQTKQFTVSGFQMDVPADLCASGDDASLGAGVALHKLPPPRGVLDDTRCLLQVSIHRMPLERFQSERATDPTGRTGDVHEKFRRWVYSRHDGVDQWDGEKTTTYRHDVDCPNGDVVTATAQVTHVYENGVSLFVKQDDATVRRMLSSMRCLERAP